MFLFRSILQWGGWRQHIPINEHEHLYTPFLVGKIRSVWKQCVKSLYRWTWNCPCQHLRKPVLLAMLQPEDTILQLLNAMSDRLACDDGFVQLASSWRHMPIVPHLSEDLSDIQDLPRVSWMYESVSDFLDTCFRLLRADCFIPLQKGIRDFINGSLDPRDMRIFRGSFQHFHLVRGSKGLVASIECTNVFNYAVPFQHAFWCLATSYVCRSVRDPLKKSCGAELLSDLVTVQLRRRKPWQWPLNFWMIWFLAGVLEGFRVLFFRSFQCQSLFWTTVRHKQVNLLYMFWRRKGAPGDIQSDHIISILHKCGYDSRSASRNRIDRSSFISCLLAPPPGGLLLAESPVFFLSFGPVLRRLQALTGGAHGTLPLRSCLLGQRMSAQEAHAAPVWSDYVRTSLEEAIISGERSFDESQRTALEVILSSRLSTIQGPPGGELLGLLWRSEWPFFHKVFEDGLRVFQNLCETH